MIDARAAVLEEPSGEFTIEEVQLEEPREDEVLVRIESAGICHTDLSTRDQHHPIETPVVLGHEGAGVVERVGERVTEVDVGDRVVISYDYCGRCGNCRRGKPSYCGRFHAHNFSGGRAEDGSSPISLNGEEISGVFFGQSSFATHAIANERNVVRCPPGVPVELLGPLGCGVQTGAGSVLNVLEPDPGSSIAVFGTGPVGLSAVMAAVVEGCAPIIGIDLSDDRLRMAAKVGATDTIQPADCDPVEAIVDITDGGAQYAVDTTGSPDAFRQAVDCTTTLGTTGLIGGPPRGTEVTLDMSTLLRGRTIRGIIEGDSIPPITIPKLIDLHVRDRFPFDELVTYYDLSEINDAVDDFEAKRVVKPVLRP